MHMHYDYIPKRFISSLTSLKLHVMREEKKNMETTNPLYNNLSIKGDTYCK